MKVEHIPDAIIPIILSSLTQNDAVSFASTSPSFYHRFMNDFVRLITLKSTGRIYDFLTNEEFRIRIANKIHDPYQQLQFCVPSRNGVPFLQNAIKERGHRFHPITKLQRLDLNCELLIPFNKEEKKEEYDLFDCFEKINHVIIEFSNHYHHSRQVTHFLLRLAERNIFGINPTSSIMNQNLLDLKNLTHLEFRDLLTRLDSIDWIPGLQSITLRRMNGELRCHPKYGTQLKSITFISCSDLTDVSIYKEVPRIYIENCFKISNISFLKNNEEVHIIDCWNILDYSQSFHSTERISLVVSNPASYINLDVFQATVSLKIHGRKRIDGSLANLQSTLRILRKVSLTDCSSITSVSNLKNVPVLILSELTNLKSLSGLESGRTQVIEINRCKNISDFLSLRNIPTVRIYSCAKFIDFNDVSNVKTLSLTSCRQNISNLSALSQLEVLVLREFSPALPLAELKPLKGLSLSWKDTGTVEYIMKYGITMSHQMLTLSHCSYAEFLDKCHFLPEMQQHFDIVSDEIRRIITFYKKK
eukprot:gene4076-4360_t